MTDKLEISATILQSIYGADFCIVCHGPWHTRQKLAP